MPELAAREFAAFRRLIFEAAGIELHGNRQALVRGRLGRRLRHYGLEHFGGYLDLVRGDPAEHRVMVDLLTTNETGFFREPAHFELLRDRLLPALHDTGRLRLWSAACSTGEEPYSVAMVLDDCWQGGWEIVATDISGRVLEQARRGAYRQVCMDRIPQAYRTAYCQGGDPGREEDFLIHERLRRGVDFSRLNLNGDWPSMGAFHLILLRNVMIYFNRETRKRLVRRIADCLAPGGYLLIGHAESVTGMDERLYRVHNAVYRLAG